MLIIAVVWLYCYAYVLIAVSGIAYVLIAVSGIAYVLIVVSGIYQ